MRQTTRNRLLCLVLTLASALAIPGLSASAAPRTTALWGPCDLGVPTPPSLRCATVSVPRDWSDPGGASINVAIDRLPALDAKHRIGSLLINPGGPGGSGVLTVAQGGMLLTSPQLASLRQRFDIIGFDPRGVGGSAPITCDPALLHDPTVTMFPRTPAQYQRLVDLDRAAGASCQPSGLLPHLDTISAARDVDAIRAAIGEHTISWLGVSYGTELGQAYAALFPSRVRAMVLDGAVDHTRSVARASIDEARAIEREFARFAAWCGRTTDCALHGHDVPALFDKLNIDADNGKVVASTWHRDVTAEEVTDSAYNYLIEPQFWPQLAMALAKAAGVDGPADASTLVEAASFADPSDSPYRAIGCQDFPPESHGFADLSARAALLPVVAPHTWRYSEMWDMTSGCVGWPVLAANPPGPVHVTGTPPVLVVGNSYDPSTPYLWAQALASQIDGSVLLTDVSDGHTGLYNSACARQHEADYLVSGQPPAPGSICTD